jgi:hemerythrin-like domain-containing protein
MSFSVSPLPPIKGVVMARTRATTANKSSDAIAMLKADHDKVRKLFKEFERMLNAESDEEAERLATQICNELTVHTTLEEEIFYPEVRAAIDDEDLIDEAEVEHASAKELIAQIESAHSGDEKFAARVIVLGEYVNHHIKEEQDEIFPKAKRAKVDMAALASRMAARKEELKAEMGMMDEEIEDEEAAPLPPKKRRSGRSVHAGRG